MRHIALEGVHEARTRRTTSTARDKQLLLGCRVAVSIGLGLDRLTFGRMTNSQIEYDKHREHGYRQDRQHVQDVMPLLPTSSEQVQTTQEECDDEDPVHHEQSVRLGVVSLEEEAT